MSNVTRRDFLKLVAGGGALAMMPRIGWSSPQPGEPMWINVQAMGGWDPTLSFDPRPALRKTGLNRMLYLYGVPILQNGVAAMGTGLITPATSTVLRSTPGGGIPYLGFADFHGDPANPNHPYKCFLPTYYDRITIINGIDTGTNNHDIGGRYCSSGSNNQGYPCFATQVAYVRGSDRPLAFLNLGGYDETAGLIAASPLAGSALPNLQRAVAPNDRNGDNTQKSFLLEPGAWDAVQKAHAARLQRQRAALRLPEQRRAIDGLASAESGQGTLSALQFNANDQSLGNVLALGIDAFRRGLASSMNVPVSGFDTHGDNEQGQASALYDLFETVKLLLQQTESPTGGKAPVPAVIAVTSDFGRSPYYRNAGTDHWPVTSVMLVQNSLAKAKGLALPTNTVIGATSGGDATLAQRAQKIDPKTFAVDAGGVVLTPGHVVRALRRVAGIDGSPKLAAWPLTVDRDLAIG